MFSTCRKARPGRRRRWTWLSRVGRSQEHDRPTCTGRRSGAGKGQRARYSVVPARQYSGCRLRHRTPPASRAAQAKREASEGWTTRASSEDTRGELLRTKRGAVPEEGVSDRDKPSLSRETGEAISIQRASRKPTCKGGGETRGVTRRQRRSREWSETARWTRVDLAAVLKRHDAPGTRAKTPPRRRTTRRSGSSTS